jgi:hypothetical protein
MKKLAVLNALVVIALTLGVALSSAAGPKKPAVCKASPKANVRACVKRKQQKRVPAPTVDVVKQAVDTYVAEACKSATGPALDACRRLKQGVASAFVAACTASVGSSPAAVKACLDPKLAQDAAGGVVTEPELAGGGDGVV